MNTRDSGIPGTRVYPGPGRTEPHVNTRPRENQDAGLPKTSDTLPPGSGPESAQNHRPPRRNGSLDPPPGPPGGGGPRTKLKIFASTARYYRRPSCLEVQESFCAQGTSHKKVDPETGLTPVENKRKTKDKQRKQQKLRGPRPT